MAAVGTAFPQPIQVRVEDALGRPAANASLRFFFLYGPPDAYALFSNDSLTTGADGLATVTAIANQSRGTRSYFATLPNASITGNKVASFVLSNLPLPPTY